ncbi:MAG: DHA2 family efflux MFS transporter permease subunit [Deltaproteobacteria bacterium]|nr:DHA2 family efflux MFS transporter permease subunit [Deltaproteobacteria bacterium]
MEVLDTTIVNVALPHIAGTLSATTEESTWVLTSYLVANAMVLPVSAWLASLMGRKRFYMTCVAIFTLSSVLCGAAPTLGSLVLVRIVQGLGGGGLQPSQQAILVDTFPPYKLGMAFAMTGIAVVTAPILGPTLGGWITDNFSWRWVFYINLPVGLLSLFLTWRLVEDPPHARRIDRRSGFTMDYLGLGLVALGIGCLQIVLDKGQTEDWFDSHFIQIFAALAVIGWFGSIVWELRHRHPVVDLRLFKDWNFAKSTVLMFALGFVLYGSTVLLPLLMQTQMGYTALLAGLAMSPGGLVVVFLMPVAGRLVSKVQPRWIAAFGMLVLGTAMLHMTSFTLEMDFTTLVLARCFQSAALAFLFIPISTTAYASVAPGKNNSASALLTLARNLGGSVGIATVTTVLAQRFQYHHSVLVSHVTAYDPGRALWLEHAAAALRAAGSSAASAAAQAQGLLYKQVVRQATILSYLDNFWLLGVGALALVPLALTLRRIPLGRPASGGH